MNILNDYIEYETFQTRHFIESCRDLTPEQLHQSFDIGQGSLHETIAHLTRNLEAWTDIMLEKPGRQFHRFPDEVDALLAMFDSAMAEFSGHARAIISENRLDDLYVDTREDPPLSQSYGGTILHVLIHTTGHRQEIQHMLQRFGITDPLIDGDYIQWELLKRYNKI